MVAKFFVYFRCMCIFFVLMFFCTHIFAQGTQNPSLRTDIPHGIELCDDLFDFFKSKGINVQKENIVAPGDNIFPYNITAFFKGKNNTALTSEGRDTLLLAFTAEDAYRHKDAVSEIIDYILQNETECDVTVLFSYDIGNNIKNNIENINTVSGNFVFASQYEDPETAAAVCISFDADEKPYIISGGDAKNSPSWLVSYVVSAFYKHGIKFILHGGLFTSLYSLDILKADERTSNFLSEEIPSVFVAFTKHNSDSDVARVISSIINAYKILETSDWERHYIFICAENSFFVLNEKNMVISFIIVIFAAIFFLIVFSIVNSQSRIVARETANLLYVTFLSYVISALSLILSEKLAYMLLVFFPTQIYIYFVIKIIVSFIAIIILYDVASYFGLVISEVRYWYLLAIVAAINVLVFSFIDISLFYIFIVLLGIIFLSRTVHKSVFLVVSFFLMAIPFIIFIYQISHSVDTAAIKKFVFLSLKENLFFSLVLLPFYLQWIRIVSSFVKRKAQKLTMYIPPIIIALTILGGALVAAKINTPLVQSETTETVYLADEFPKITVTDTTSFDGMVRTIDIYLGEGAYSCDVAVVGTDEMPLIYSDNEYVSDTTNLVSHFVIPAWPPAVMRFRYIVGEEHDSVLNVKAVYFDKSENVSEADSANKKIIVREKQISFKQKNSRSG